jgi:hypothetical protein
MIRRCAVLAATALCSLLAPVCTAAQEANISTSVASPGSGPSTSLINLDAVAPKPATDRSLALPTLILADDGSGPQVRRLVLELPDLDFGAVAVASRVGDQALPAVFRGASTAGSGLASPLRGVTFATTGRAAVSLALGQMGKGTAVAGPDAPALAAAALKFTPTDRVSMTPQVLVPVGVAGAPARVGTAITARVPGDLALTTDVGAAGAADRAWAPLASAGVVGQWPRAGIETSVLRGAAAPAVQTGPAVAAARDREAARAQVQPLPGLTVVALASASRPAADRDAPDTVVGSVRIAYDGLPAGQLATTRQRETTASRESETASLEWRQSGLGHMTVRYVQQRATDAVLEETDESSSRVEMELPALTPQAAGRVDVRAALSAGTSSLTGPGVNSRVSGRVGLSDKAALTGETEFGLSGSDGRVLRALRLTTDVPVVPATRLQLSYSYRVGTQYPLGQIFEARLLRRLRLGW